MKPTKWTLFFFMNEGKKEEGYGLCESMIGY